MRNNCFIFFFVYRGKIIHLRKFSYYMQKGRVHREQNLSVRFHRKKSPYAPLPSLHSISLIIRDNLNILGIDIHNDLNPRDHIESVISCTSRRLGILTKMRWFFTPEQLYLLTKLTFGYVWNTVPIFGSDPQNTSLMPWTGCNDGLFA